MSELKLLSPGSAWLEEGNAELLTMVDRTVSLTEMGPILAREMP